jgi:asparagine N-glycosylation enzyme membrane subunit Stt3
VTSFAVPGNPHEISARRDRLLFAAALVLLLLVAFLLRLAGAAGAFDQGELVTLDGDSLYHLHRMRLIADQFPGVPWIDPLIAWPAGAPIPWAAGFDLLGAALILLGRALGGPAGGDLLVAALCPLLGVAVVAAVVELALLLQPPRPGRRAGALAAGILAALLPQGVAIARYGRIDHHVAEALVMLLLARWALAILPPWTPETTRRRLFHELAGGAIAGGAMLVFTGSPLYVALVVPLLAGATLLRERPTLVGSGGPGLLVAALLASLASAPAVAAHGRTFAFGFPSWLQPLLLAAAGLAVCAVAAIGGRVPPGRRRLGLALAGGAGLALLGGLLVPQGLGQAVAGLREWLFKADPWLRTIDEFQSPLAHPGGPSVALAGTLGLVGLATPVLLLVAWWSTRRASPARAAGFLWIASAMAGLTLLQMRFGRVFVPFLAISAGLSLGWVAGRFGRAGRLAPLAPLIASLALLDPSVRAALGTIRDPLPNGMVEVARELRGRPAGANPGVLTPWDMANEVLVLAGRPVVVTGFGPYPDPAAFWETVKAYTVSEDELLPWLAGRRVGWVVAGAANLFGRVRSPEALIPFSKGEFDPRWLLGTPSAPLLIGGSGVPALGVRHFERLMPIVASTRTVGGLKSPLPVIWLFELVAGAKLTGQAPPGARVVLEIPITEHGRPHTWRAWADAGPDGRWQMMLPLPTDLSTRTIRTAMGRLRVGDGAARPIEITESTVREGGVIAAPGDTR